MSLACIIDTFKHFETRYESNSVCPTKVLSEMRLSERIPSKPSKPLRERNGLNISRLQLFRSTSKIRGRHGGVENRGGRKTSRTTPLPKTGFGQPFVWYVFQPPSGVFVLFFMYRNSKLSTPEALLEGSEFYSGGCAGWCIFIPP